MLASLHHTRHILEVLFNDEVSLSKYNSAAILIVQVSCLISGLLRESIKAEILSQIEQETARVSLVIEASIPTI